MKSIPYILSKDALTVLLDGRNIPVARGHEKFETVLELVKAGDEDSLRQLLNPKAVVAAASAARGDDAVQLVDGELVLNGQPLTGPDTSRILEMHRDGMGITPLLNFMTLKEQNPSYRARNELLGFMDACRLPITEDGHILAYKVVAPNYTDLYTGKMDNSIGATPKMDRRMVDDDCNRTCSAGLHFASLEYIEKGGYGTGCTSSNHLMIVKINPKDVVSIPTDYNNSKGRACEYLILEEVSWNTRIEVDNFGYDADADEWEEEEEEEGNEWEEEENEEEEQASTVTRPASAKLSENDVRRFLKLLKTDQLTLTAACKIIGISRRQGGRIRDGENWADVS